jgi:hypothetical protein
MNQRVLKFKEKVVLKCDNCEKITGYLMVDPKRVVDVVRNLVINDVCPMCKDCVEIAKEPHIN